METMDTMSFNANEERINENEDTHAWMTMEKFGQVSCGLGKKIEGRTILTSHRPHAI